MDNDLKKASFILEKGALFSFPGDLEKKYRNHHSQNRLVISNLLIYIGITVFLLFSVLDYIVFPLEAAYSAWIIRVVTTIFILSVYLFYKIKQNDIQYIMFVVPVFCINCAVVAIDVIGVNKAGYDLPLGGLFVIIAASTLLRFPFNINLLLTLSMFFINFFAIVILTDLHLPQILNTFFRYLLIVSMILFSSYSIDSDSRRIFLLNLLRKKYEKSGLDDAEAEKLVHELDTFINEEKPYLNPELRIDDLSEALKCKKHYVSQVLSERYNKNFYTYINEFRIKEAKRFMDDDSFQNMGMLQIALESGFNSKPTFNRVFKTLTGITPTEYRNRR